MSPVSDFLHRMVIEQGLTAPADKVVVKIARKLGFDYAEALVRLPSYSFYCLR